MIKHTAMRAGWLLAGCLAMVLLLVDCQGGSPGLQGPRPRSREAAGEKEELPAEADTSNRYPIGTDGGVVEYRYCTVSIPRGAFPDAIFLEVSVPAEAPRDVLDDTAYQINPDGLELLKDGVISIGYFDEDVPAGKEEEDLVIVHSVNNVWVELTNSKIHIYNNTIEAPISFLGLYAIRVASDDPRRLNTPPVASFQFSHEPFPASLGKPFEAAQAEMEEAAEPLAEEAAAEEEGKVNINTASLEELQAIDGVDEVLAQNIVNYRNLHGAFDAIPKLLEVEGIDEEVLDQLEPQITLGAQAAPAERQNLVNINTASLEELMTVTGLDDVLSQRVIDYRNEHGPFNSTSELERIKGIGPESILPMLPEVTVGTEEGSADHAFVLERRLVAGPEDEAAESAGNVAEGAALALADDEEAAADETPRTTIYFDASASHDPDGKVVQYDWDFDADGIFDYTSHASPYAKYDFRYNGDYSVVLKVTDNGRYAQSGFGTGLVKVRNAAVEPRPLAANISCFPPFGPAPLTVHLAATVTGGVPPYAYTWTFSDGSESDLPNPFTTYPEPGEHILSFEVTDVEGGKLSGGLLVESLVADRPVKPQPRMQLDISPYAERGYAPLTAKFQLSVDRATAPVTYRVTYGDEDAGEPETTTTDNYLTHYYGNSGFYLMEVTATDADLRTATTFATVHVLSPDIERDFTVSAAGLGGDPYSFGHEMHIVPEYTAASPRTVRFKPEDTPRLEGELTYHWDFGDGTFATESKPAHTYASDGVFEVRLTASDGLQRWRHRIWLPVSTKDPAAAIQRPSYVEGPAPLRLDLDAIVTRGEQPFRYDWFIGDARRSDASTYYVFPTAGEYEIRLDVYDKWNEPIHAPPVEVRVRPSPDDYRAPLAVIEPLAGSTRATVMDFAGAEPLPLSSPHVEGAVRLVDLSADGQRLAIAGEEGLLVKRVSNGDPIVSLLPAAGEIVAARALSADAAYCTLESAGGLATYLLRPGQDPALIGGGMLLSCNGRGTQVVLGPEPAYGETTARLLSVDVISGYAEDPVELPRLSEAALTADGGALYFIDSEMRLVRRTLPDGEDEYYSRGEDTKRGLTVSADGSAVAFVAELGGELDVIFGTWVDEANARAPMGEGTFRLASVTGLTGFVSEHLRLSRDGRYLLGYGSRTRLQAMLDAEREQTVAEDEAAALEPEAEEPAVEEEAEPEYEPRPPARRERFGVIRLDLGRAPDSWRISTVDARFIAEGGAIFDVAGPF